MQCMCAIWFVISGRCTEFLRDSIKKKLTYIKKELVYTVFIALSRSQLDEHYLSGEKSTEQQVRPTFCLTGQTWIRVDLSDFFFKYISRYYKLHIQQRKQNYIQISISFHLFSFSTRNLQNVHPPTSSQAAMFVCPLFLRGKPSLTRRSPTTPTLASTVVSVFPTSLTHSCYLLWLSLLYSEYFLLNRKKGYRCMITMKSECLGCDEPISRLDAYSLMKQCTLGHMSKINMRTPSK